MSAESDNPKERIAMHTFELMRAGISSFYLRAITHSDDDWRRAEQLHGLPERPTDPSVEAALVGERAITVLVYENDDRDDPAVRDYFVVQVEPDGTLISDTTIVLASRHGDGEIVPSDYEGESLTQEQAELLARLGDDLVASDDES